MNRTEISLGTNVQDPDLGIGVVVDGTEDGWIISFDQPPPDCKYGRNPVVALYLFGACEERLTPANDSSGS